MQDQDTADTKRGEVLVAIMNDKRALALLQEQLWYRIPVESAPKRWPPQWLAFYQTKVFGDEAYAVRYYGRVAEIERVPRRELFPHEFPNPKSDRMYYRLRLDSFERLPQPIVSRRWRRIVFIATTWQKFSIAVEINDLYDESPLEDRLWAELKRERINAERQWDLKLNDARYLLDFAVFCQKGQIDIETDGDSWHTQRKRIAADNLRDNTLQTHGWEVLRFNTQVIRESAAQRCLPKITKMINRLGGLADEGLVARKFYSSAEGTIQQLTLFEESEDYEVD